MHDCRYVSSEDDPLCRIVERLGFFLLNHLT